MAMKFRCKSCDENIIVQFLNVGDSAECKNCGMVNQVPESSEIVDDKQPGAIHSQVKQSAPEKELSARGGESVNPDDKKRFITPSGAGIALICFFLPWAKFSCMGEVKYQSGADLGGIFWAVFVAALAILAAYFVFSNNKQLKKAKPIVIASSLIALGILLYQYIRYSLGVETDLGKIKLEDIGFSLQFGGIGTVIGYLLALFGTSFLNSNGVEPERVAQVKSERVDYDDPDTNWICPKCSKANQNSTCECSDCHYKLQ
jgi:hypothetical protein